MQTDQWSSKLSTSIQCEKNNHSAFLIFQKIYKKINKKKTIFLAYFGILLLKTNYRKFYLHSLFLPALINVFYMFSTVHPHLSLLFSHFVLLYLPSFSYSSRQEIYSTIYNLKPARNIREIKKHFSIHD